DVSFMIITDNKGNTVGRFIEVGEDTFINLYYNNMAYETAFLNGGESIIREYINNQKSIDYEFELDYKDRDIGYESEWVKDVVKSRMGKFASIFYMNDFIKINRKR
ncbi:MAG: hypothetical protein QW607_11045, partial [Desulfurococcaceae archaeon]